MFSDTNFDDISFLIIMNFFYVESQVRVVAKVQQFNPNVGMYMSRN